MLPLSRCKSYSETFQEGHGKPGGRTDAARRLEEAHKLLEEVSNMLADMRRELLGGRQR